MRQDTKTTFERLSPLNTHGIASELKFYTRILAEKSNRQSYFELKQYVLREITANWEVFLLYYRPLDLF